MAFAGDKMRAHFLVQPGLIELRELPLPQPAAGEVVVRIRSALTCGTDVKAFVRGHPKFPMPTPFGHEFAGEIAAVGNGVRSVHEGDAIMATPTAPCGHCYHCERQQENLCDTIMSTMVLGAYAEYIRLPARIVTTNLYNKPSALPFAVAALLEPLSCVAHGLSFVPLRADDHVVLIGSGAISLLHLLALRSMGVQNVSVIGRSKQRAEHASQLGARAVLTDGLAAAHSAILEQTRGRGADVVVECTGQVEIWQAAPGFARRGGTVVFFGGCTPGSQVQLDTQRVHYDQLRLISPFHFTPRAVRTAYEMLAQGGLDGAALVTGTYPFERLPEALNAHRAGAGIKFAIQP